MSRYINFLVEDKNIDEIYHVGKNHLFNHLRDFFDAEKYENFYVYSTRNISDKVKEKLTYNNCLDKEEIRDFSVIKLNWLSVLESKVAQTIADEEITLKKSNDRDDVDFHTENISDLKNVFKELIILQALITENIELGKQTFEYTDSVFIYFWHD